LYRVGFILFALLGFYLFIFNKYHCSFVYFYCCILFMCIHTYIYFIYLYIYVHIYIYIYICICKCIYIYIYKCIYVFVFVNHCHLYLYCFIFIVYDYVSRHRYILCFAFIHLFTCIFGIWIEQAWCKHSHISTCSGGWNRYG